MLYKSAVSNKNHLCFSFMNIHIYFLYTRPVWNSKGGRKNVHKVANVLTHKTNTEDWKSTESVI